MDFYCIGLVEYYLLLMTALLEFWVTGIKSSAVL